MSAPEHGSFLPKALEVTQVHGNLTQEIVAITVDRLRLVLHLHAKDIGRRFAWLTPAGILLTLALSMSTTTFRDWLLPAATWYAIFLLLAIAAAFWLVVSAIQALRAGSVEELVQRIKKQQV